MNKWATFLIMLVVLTPIACTAGEQNETLQTPRSNPSSTFAGQGEPPAADSRIEPTPATTAVSKINVATDRWRYRQGESIVVAIENNSTDSIQFMENCSLNLCFESGEDWICEERECDGPVYFLEPESRLELLQEGKSIGLAAPADTTSRYKLYYQIVSEDPYYFAHSDEFIVRSAGMNCRQAKQIAVEHAQSSPYWTSIDAGRATVRWQGANSSCVVDFAGKGAEEIRTSLWSEGFYAVVGAASGRVIEADAYER